MNSPYQPPQSPIGAPSRKRRFAHVVTAFAAGLVVVPLLAHLLDRLGLRFGRIGSANTAFWSAVAWGSLLAAASVYRHQRLPLAWAGTIGVAIVLLLLAAPSIWAWVLP
ncbi:hypothetical protein [Pseudoxanthomonas beigongshangi]|uniref:hypothetical protein n=1 Tax=Pseudoxanthomonas beigongshangi TaxID=2782537 RepID=UPI00193C6EBE|nr:hypothetical protein [Pseudoxanthomonas beigongshangi]